MAFTSHFTPKYVNVKEAAKPSTVEITLAMTSLLAMAFFASDSGKASAGTLSISEDVKWAKISLKLN